MKKNILLALLILLMFIGVKADASVPTIRPYDIVVTNKDGAFCYDRSGDITKEKIEYGTVLQVLEIIDEYYYIAKNECRNGYIKISDATIKEDVFDPVTNKRAKSIESEYGVKDLSALILKDNVMMKKGPDDVYGDILAIPKNEIVKVSYVYENWFYTSYNNKSGWINSYNMNFGYDGYDIFFSDSDINITDESNNVIAKIPARSEITNYMNTHKYRCDILVNYNDINGCVSNDSLFIKAKGKIKLLKDVDLKKYDSENNLVSQTIPKDTILTVEGYYSERTVPFHDDYYVKELNDVISVTKDEYQIIEEIQNIKKTSGFIGEGYFGEKIVNNGADQIQELKKDDKEVNIINSEKENKNYQIIVLCVFVAICLSITVYVIIKLFNKKNKEVNYE